MEEMNLRLSELPDARLAKRIDVVDERIHNLALGFSKAAEAADRIDARVDVEVSAIQSQIKSLEIDVVAIVNKVESVDTDMKRRTGALIILLAILAILLFALTLFALKLSYEQISVFNSNRRDVPVDTSGPVLEYTLFNQSTH